MRQPDWADIVYRRFYPTVVPGDPANLEEFGQMLLMPEVEGALCRFYGSATVSRRKRRPGINYNDRAWRMRLCQMPFQYHPRLFEIMDELRLTPHTINTICKWWGTKAEVDSWEQLHPGGVTDEDDIWDGIEDKRAKPSLPFATFPEDLPRQRPPSPPRVQRRRRSTSIRHLLGLGRPRGITSITELHQDARTNAGEDEDVVQSSVGVSLNNQLQAGIRNTEFEDWLKEETESGRLLGDSGMHRNTAQQSPFTLNTNTISYSVPPQHYYGHSYSQRVSDRPYQGDLHTLPVAISGPSESALRSSQPRQRTLTRYRTPGAYGFRPIRPRPARSSS